MDWNPISVRKVCINKAAQIKAHHGMALPIKQVLWLASVCCLLGFTISHHLLHKFPRWISKVWCSILSWVDCVFVSALLLLYDVTNKSSFDNIRVSIYTIWYSTLNADSPLSAKLRGKPPQNLEFILWRSVKCPWRKNWENSEENGLWRYW